MPCRSRSTARQWSWSFEYENGKQDTVLRVPVRKPVKLLITSADVLHSLSIPAYRIKEDAVPGRETYLWFLPDELGSYDLFCTEYCGVAHSAMITKVEVMDQKDFDAWYEGEERCCPRRKRGPCVGSLRRRIPALRAPSSSPERLHSLPQH